MAGDEDGNRISNSFEVKDALGGAFLTLWSDSLCTNAHCWTNKLASGYYTHFFGKMDMEMRTCRFSSISWEVSNPISFSKTFSAQTVATSPRINAYKAYRVIQDARSRGIAMFSVY